MNKTSKTILFFGNERLATGITTTAPVLRALVDSGYSVAAVIVAQDKVATSRKDRQLEISSVASSYAIPVLSISSLANAHDELAIYSAEAAVLVAYGKLIPASIINLFPKGIINLHPSLLPKHRGPTPLESTILNGDKQTGVSLMQLTTKMDAGPIYAQETVTLQTDVTKQALADQLANLGKEMLVSHLPFILDGTAQPKAQDDSGASYDKLITKTMGNFDAAAWSQPVELLSRKVRAYTGWPRTHTKISTTDVIITSSHTTSGKGTPGTLWKEAKQFGIYGLDGVLVIDRLIPVGKREMSGQAFLAGYQLQ